MSTLGELRAALELALDWYEPKHDDVVPRWVVLARVALVAEGQGAPDFALPEQRDLTPVEQAALRRVYAKLYKPVAAVPSPHKEGLQARFTRALANNNILEQMILANWKAGSNPATSININGLINDLVDVLGEVAGHKEGAGGEPQGKHICCWERENPHRCILCCQCGKKFEPPLLPLQRTLPDEQFKGAIVERMLKSGKRALTEEERELVVEAIETPAERLREALELYLRTYADTQTHPTVIEEANCINVARAALASPAGRAEQAAKDGEN